jgi:hypothetical protein
MEAAAREILTEDGPEFEVLQAYARRYLELLPRLHSDEWFRADIEYDLEVLEAKMFAFAEGASWDELALRGSKFADGRQRGTHTQKIYDVALSQPRGTPAKVIVRRLVELGHAKERDGYLCFENGARLKLSSFPARLSIILSKRKD